LSFLFDRYASIISNASEAEIRSDATLGSRLLLSQSGNITVSYAPFEHIEHGAKVVVVGITPGEQQARNALLEARRQLISGASHSTALEKAKVFASFSGPMRTNLIAMLDHIGLHRWAGLGSMAELWDGRSDLIHFTSALRYPVFVNGGNYSGQPSMTATPMLRELLNTCLKEEALALPGAIWIPLGPKATQGIEWIIQQGALDRNSVLIGLPHPSGATEPLRLDAARERLTTQILSLCKTEVGHSA